MSIVPTLSEAIAGRDLGMENAEKGAGKGWADYAVDWVRRYVAAHPNTTFRTEHVRAWSYAQGCALPISGNDKAWGPVMKKAEKQQVVIICGTSLALSSHHSPKMLWKAL